MNQIWFQYLNNLAGRKIWFDGLIVFFGEYFGWIILACLGVYLLFKQERKVLKLVVFSLASGTAAFILALLIKVFYFHPRPFAFLENVRQLIIHSPSASFPSGHAAFFFGLATGIYFFNKKLSIAFFAAAFLIGVSRVIAGIHWPFDIIAGAVVGLASAFLLRYFWYRYRDKLF
ncbi:MAG: phosphatase PAP2 family protein [Patescibacteria group bacterium]